jgi:chaperonin GroES
LSSFPAEEKGCLSLFRCSGCAAFWAALLVDNFKIESFWRYRGMKLKPLNDRVLVKRLEVEEMTAGGIIIPDSAKEKPMKGEVVAAGEGKLDENGKRVAMTVKAGDTVLFAKYAGTEIKIDGVEHLVMREDDILAVVE